MEAGRIPRGLRQAQPRATASIPPPAPCSTWLSATRRKGKIAAPGASSGSRSPRRARPTAPSARSSPPSTSPPSSPTCPSYHHRARRCPEDPGPGHQPQRRPAQRRRMEHRAAGRSRAGRDRGARARLQAEEPHDHLANKQHSTIAAEGLELAPIFRPPPPYWTDQAYGGGDPVRGGRGAAGVGAYFGVAALNDVNNSNGGVPQRRRGRAALHPGGRQRHEQRQHRSVGLGHHDRCRRAAALAGAYLFLTGGADTQEGAPVARDASVPGSELDGTPSVGRTRGRVLSATF